MKVFSVFGTRPEAIKMCPLVKRLEAEEWIESVVCLTGQHREMLQQVIEIFGIQVKYNLDIMRPLQTLTTITADILERIEEILKAEQPDIVLVHGDTTTSFAAALAAFYQKIPVGHVEAGLRTYNKYSPYPEEMNRCLTSRIAEYHFSPTNQNSGNLIQEGIEKNVFVTGNTVIDSFETTIKKSYLFHEERLNQINLEKRNILLTAHRRENLGESLSNICEAVRQLARQYQDVNIIYPVHLNPMVRNVVFPALGELENVYLTEPLDVEDMHNLMSKCYLVMTDSGGLQEEAPALGLPVLVLRTETERPEAVQAGTAKVVGVETDIIIEEVKRLLEDKTYYKKMANAVNPYGDGHASERIIQILKEHREEMV